jgi:NAD(P)-dependent dehydrogenase (short-subunit alcohol dehydrogenase family)
MNARPSDLSGRTALVTGAGKRLGRAISLALAEAGVNVVAHYNTSQSAAEDVAGEVRRLGPKAWTIPGDLSRPEQIAGLTSRAKDLTGGFDILIHSASVFPADTLKDATLESIAANQQINALAPLVLSREFAAFGTTGHIIHMLDTRAFDHDPQHFAYHLSKRTLFTLTRIMAAEFAPKIQVNAIAPGLILPPEGKDESYLASLAHTNPLHRHGDPRDITDAVLFLLRSTFITGQVIHVDGGRHLKGAFYGGQ